LLTSQEHQGWPKGFSSLILLTSREHQGWPTGFSSLILLTSREHQGWPTGFSFLCCVLFVLFVLVLCLMCPMLPVSLECPSLAVSYVPHVASVSGMSIPSCLPLRFSLMFVLETCRNKWKASTFKWIIFKRSKMLSISA
jgi:hypothetical protein